MRRPRGRASPQVAVHTCRHSDRSRLPIEGPRSMPSPAVDFVRGPGQRGYGPGGACRLLGAEEPEHERLEYGVRERGPGRAVRIPAVWQRVRDGGVVAVLVDGEAGF